MKTNSKNHLFALGSHSLIHSLLLTLNLLNVCCSTVTNAPNPTRVNKSSGCTWTPEQPRIDSSTLEALHDSEIICHDHLMVLFRKDIGFPFASYAVHTQEEMTQLTSKIFK